MAPPKKLNWWHTQIVDWMLGNPEKKLRDCAAALGVSQPWLSTIIHTDIFQNYAQSRMAQHHLLVSNDIIGKAQALADLSLDVLTERIEDERDTMKLKEVRASAELSLKALGYTGGDGGGSDRNSGVTILVGADSTVLAAARERIRNRHSPAGGGSRVIEGSAAPAPVPAKPTGEAA